MVVVDGDNRIEHPTSDCRDLLEKVRGFQYGDRHEDDDLPGLLRRS